MRYRPISGSLGSLGDDAPAEPTAAQRVPTVSPPSLRTTLGSEPVSTVSAIALTYHGYRRTNSLVWALVYGLAGKWFPTAAVPISIAQGFGQKKACP